MEDDTSLKSNVVKISLLGSNITHILTKLVFFSFLHKQAQTGEGTEQQQEQERLVNATHALHSIVAYG